MTLAKKTLLGFLALMTIALVALTINYLRPSKRMFRHYEKGEIYFKTGKYFEATQEYRAALEIAPNNTVIRSSLANAYQKERNLEKAKEQFIILIKQAPKSEDSYKSLISLYVAEKKNQEALDVCDDFLCTVFLGKEKSELTREDLQPNTNGWEEKKRELFADFLNQRGVILAQLKQDKLSEEMLLNSIEVFPGEATSYRLLSSLYWKNKDQEKAIEMLLRSLEIEPESYENNFQIGSFYMMKMEHEKAVKHFRLIHLKYPEKNHEIASSLALSLLITKNYEQAIKLARESLKKVSSRAVQNPILVYIDGVGFFQEKKYEKAIQLFEQAKRGHLQLEGLQYNLALSYKEIDQNLLAIKELNELLQKSSFLPAITLLVQLLIEEGRLDQAEKLCERAGEKYPKNLEFIKLKAFILNEKGETEKAVLHFQKITSLSPNSIEGRLGLASVDMKEKKYQAAINKLLPLLKEKPNDAYLHYLVSQNYFALNDIKNALKYIDISLKQNSQSVGSSILLAKIRFVQGTPHLAIEEYEKILMAMPENTIVRVALADLYRIVGQIEEAKETLDEVSPEERKKGIYLESLAAIYVQENKYRLAVELLEQVDPKTPEALALLGHVYRHLDNQTKAVEAYNEANKLIPNEEMNLQIAVSHYLDRESGLALEAIDKYLGSSQGNNLVRIFGAIIQMENDLEKALAITDELVGEVDHWLFYFVRASILSQKGKTKGAYQELEKISTPGGALQKSFQEIIALSQEKNLHLESLLATCTLWQMGHSPAAAVKCEEALRVIPDHPFVKYLQASVYQKLARYKDAENILKEIVSSESFVPLYVYSSLGELFLRQGKFAKAEEYLQKIVDVAPDVSSSLLSLAISQQSASKLEPAIKNYQKVLKLTEKEPKNSQRLEAYKNLALIFLKPPHIDIEYAIECAEAAYLQLPTHPKIADTLGLVHFYNGEAEKAIEYFRHANNLSPKDPSILYHLGNMYFKKGKIKFAQDILEQAISLSGRFPEVKEAEKLLGLISRIQTDKISVEDSQSQSEKKISPAQLESKLKEEIKKTPKDPSPYQQLSQLYIYQKKPDKAEKIILEYCKINPRHFNNNYSLSKLYVDTKQYDKAEALFYQLYNDFPRTHPRIVPSLILCLLGQEKIQEAARVAGKSISSFPEEDLHPILFYARGYGYLLAKDYEQAIDYLEKSRDRGFVFPDLYYRLAQAYAQKRKIDKAIAELQKIPVNKETPNYIPAHRFLIEIWQNERQPVLAIQYCEKVLKEHPKNIDILNSYAEVLKDNKNYERAEKVYAVIQGLKPKSVSASLGPVRLEMAQKNYQGAIDKLELLNKQEPENVEVLTLLANNHMKAGQLKKALEYANSLPPQAVATYIVFAEIRSAQGNLNLAAKEYGKLVENFPKDVKLTLALTNLYLLMKKPDLAMETLVQSGLDKSEDPQVWEYKGRIFMEKKEFAKARDSFLEVYDRGVNLDFLLGDCYRGEKQYEEAIKTYRELESKGSSPLLSSRIGLCYYLNGDIEKAIEVFEKHVKDFPQQNQFRLFLAALLEKKERYKQALDVTNPDFFINKSTSLWLLYSTRCILLMEQKKSLEAKKELDSIPEDQKSFRKTLWDYIEVTQKKNVGLGNLLMSLVLREIGETTQASWVAKNIPLQEEPLTVSLKASLASEQGNIQEAINLLRPFTRSSDAPAYIYRRLADLLYLQGKYEKAQGYFSRALQLEPKSADIWISLGQCCQFQKKFERAEKAYKKALSIRPKSVDILEKLAYCYEVQDKLSPAIQFYKQAIDNLVSQDKSDAAVRVHNNIAVLYLKITPMDVKMALQHALDAYEKAPDQFYVLDTLGWTYFHAKKYDKALKYLTDAHNLYPVEPTILYHLGETYSKKRNFKAAQIVLEQALSLSQDFPEAVRAEKLLQDVFRQK